MKREFTSFFLVAKCRSVEECSALVDRLPAEWRKKGHFVIGHHADAQGWYALSWDCHSLGQGYTVIDDPDGRIKLPS